MRKIKNSISPAEVIDFIRSHNCKLDTDTGKAALVISSDVERLREVGAMARSDVPWQETPGGKAVKQILKANSYSPDEISRIEKEVVRKYLQRSSGDIKVFINPSKITDAVLWQQASESLSNKDISSINGVPSSTFNQIHDRKDLSRFEKTQAFIYMSEASSPEHVRPSRQAIQNISQYKAEEITIEHIAGKEIKDLNAKLEKHIKNVQDYVELKEGAKIRQAERPKIAIVLAPFDRQMRNLKRIKKNLDAKGKEIDKLRRNLLKRITSGSVLEEIRNKVLKHKLSPQEKTQVLKEPRAKLRERIRSTVAQQTAPKKVKKTEKDYILDLLRK
jgi:hypothetical protein